MHQETSPIVKTALADACHQVAGFLPELSALSSEEKRAVLQKYIAAIEGNFVSWMGATVICARSVQGRYAASENLWVEMKDDHAGMLRAFAKVAQSEPDTAAYQAVAEGVARIRELVARLSGLECLTLMATLENTSGVFIPWLESVAKELGSDDLQYTLVHGEADIAHADQFAWALTHEMELHEDGERIVRDSVTTTVTFLRGIFETV